jgi:hypothetical protein
VPRHGKLRQRLMALRDMTASHRSAASLRACSKSSPSLMPRSGSRSRKTSSQPSASSQSRSARASALFALEWLKKMRDTANVPPAGNPSRVEPSGWGQGCHRHGGKGDRHTLVDWQKMVAWKTRKRRSASTGTRRLHDDSIEDAVER